MNLISKFICKKFLVQLLFSCETIWKERLVASIIEWI